MQGWATVNQTQVLAYIVCLATVTMITEKLKTVQVSFSGYIKANIFTC